MEREVYYLGFSPINGICNEGFYKGSITIYPTNEKGNIFFANKYIEDTKNEQFLNNYREFVYNNIKKITNKNRNAQFEFFNDKSNIKMLCSEMKGVNFIKGNDTKIIRFINNKYHIRNYLKDVVPILDYKWFDLELVEYEDLRKDMLSDMFVVQGEFGCGGETTFLVTSKKDFEIVKNTSVNFKRCAISKYCNNIPLNVTMVIGKYNTIMLQTSAQLISLSDNKFRYVGGDFIFPQTLESESIKKINLYSWRIAEKVLKLGYKGILGIDYILDSGNNIYFMEINPRYQASSFMISKCMERQCDTNLAELNYMAHLDKIIKEVNLDKINYSFINSSPEIELDEKPCDFVYNGYCKWNKNSIYRKVYNNSLLKNKCFQHI